MGLEAILVGEAITENRIGTALWGHCQGILRVQARWKLFRTLSEGMTFIWTFTSYAEKNGSETEQVQTGNQ